jgi:DNA-binding response OmpR family regulator
MSRILVAEDSERIASFVLKGLQAAGFDVAHTADGAQVLQILKLSEFDLLILDIGLPGKDGYQILEELRGTGNNIPVIVLTARDSVDDTLASFAGGADDYMSKPFSFEELLARVKRRIKSQSESPTERGKEAFLEHGSVKLNLLTRTVMIDGKDHELTAREFTMLEMLIRHAGQVLSREQLLSRVWGFDHDPGSNVVDVYVRYLRQKLGNEAIQTVRGMGYRLI